MICDHCSCNQEDLFIFNLPRGYLVCYEHINSQDISFECFVCKDHQIDKDNCFQIKKNEKKLNQIIYNEKRKSILNLCDHMDSIKQDIGSYLKDCLSSVNSKIDLKRETLKAHFNKIIDDHYESFRSQVDQHESKLKDTIKQDLNQIVTKKIRDEIQNPNQIEPTDFNALNEFLTDLKSKNLDEHLQQIEKFQNFNFYQSEIEPDLDISEKLGPFAKKKSLVRNSRPTLQSLRQTLPSARQTLPTIKPTLPSLRKSSRPSNRPCRPSDRPCRPPERPCRPPERPCRPPERPCRPPERPCRPPERPCRPSDRPCRPSNRS